jgi:16S rRNA (guanine1207-N2)-methyltransferase
MIEPYYTWQTFEAALGGESVRWAGKPGLEAWDTLRPSTRLLAEEMSSVELGQRVLDLRCGAGVCGVLAARRGADVTLCDDSLVAVEAARRTLALNGVNGQLIHGYKVTGSFELVLLDAPRGREWVRHLLTLVAQVLRPGGRLLLAGPNRGGIKGFIDDAGDLVGPCEVTRVKAGNRLAVAVASDQRVTVSEPWSTGGSQISEAIIRGRTIRFATGPGVFSRGELDAGTRALIETMVIRSGEAVLDLGCGCGVVGAVAAQMGGKVVCVDSSAIALQATRTTCELNGVIECMQVLASDGASAVRDRRFDLVATNPPFHQGLGVEHDAAQQFVRDAAHVLNQDGKLYLVANRFIRYERMMRELFSRVTTAYEDNRFRVLVADGRVR